MPATLPSIVKKFIPDSSARKRGSSRGLRYSNVILAEAGIHTESAELFSMLSMGPRFREDDGIFRGDDGIFREDDGIFREDDGMFREDDGMFREDDGIFREEDGNFSRGRQY
jgi:hypothetical protein